MELKDFVRDTLLDIVQGVKEAQDVCSAEGAIISPRDAGIPGSRVNIKGKIHHVQIVDFEAVLGEESTEESKMSGKGKIAVLLSNIGIGGELSNKQEGKNNIMTIKEIQDSIVDDFSMLDDWMDRYSMIIEMGKECPVIDPQYRNDNYLINGCQSRVWLHAEKKDGKIYFTADSDAVITKGIINLLIKVFSGQTPDDILAADLSFLDKIGLKEHLSPTRSNGLLSMVKQMMLYAKVMKEQ